MVWNIRFGKSDAWKGLIDSAIDRAIFKYKIGDLHREDFAKFDCVVPLDLPDYNEIKSNYCFYGKKFWAPDRDVVDLCHDKLALNRLLLGGKFAELVPPLRESSKRQFPYIAKRRLDGYGRNSFVVKHSDDEQTIDTKLQSSDYFCQTYIPGSEEFALHVLMVDHKVIYAQTVKHKMGENYYVKGAFKHPAQTTYLSKNEHIANFSAILMELGYSGTCCIDYKMHNGLPMLLEINPRFGASLTGDINRYLAAYLASLGVVGELTPMYWATRRLHWATRRKVGRVGRRARRLLGTIGGSLAQR
jgi:hypothetical protein